MRAKKLFGPLVLMIFAAAYFVPATDAEDFADRGSVKRWKVYDYTHRPHLRGRHPYFLAPESIAFDFLLKPNTAFLVTSHPHYDGELLGDMTGRNLVAFLDVSVTPGTEFMYFGEPDGCPEPADVRYYFETDTSGKFEETDYWWSPGGVDLDSLTGPGGLLYISGFFASGWEDYFGHPATLDAAHEEAFQRAVQDVRSIGLSFGGGCSRGNGVGIVPGTGSGYFILGHFEAYYPADPL
ncbi:MAG TPA: hypothetical protein VFZ40_16205 [Pyrinomonadaceae bacterium]